MPTMPGARRSSRRLATQTLCFHSHFALFPVRTLVRNKPIQFGPVFVEHISPIMMSKLRLSISGPNFMTGP